MVTIGVELLLSNSAMYKHRCLENIKKLCKSSGKCDNQQKYKAIIEAEIFSTPQIFTDNSSMSPGPSVTVRNPIARKVLRLFTEILDIKKKTSDHWVGDSRSTRR